MEGAHGVCRKEYFTWVYFLVTSGGINQGGQVNNTVCLFSPGGWSPKPGGRTFRILDSAPQVLISIQRCQGLLYLGPLSSRVCRDSEKLSCGEAALQRKPPAPRDGSTESICLWSSLEQLLFCQSESALQVCFSVLFPVLFPACTLSIYFLSSSQECIFVFVCSTLASWSQSFNLHVCGNPRLSSLISDEIAYDHRM